VEDICGEERGASRALLSLSDRQQLVEYIKKMQFIPGGRYLYYAGRAAKFYNNCFLLKAEFDSREEWANVTWRAMNCLTTGGGIGIDYSILRPAGRALSRTGGKSSGPLPLMSAINEVGRSVMQGGSRRSAIYASLNWKHEDIPLFMNSKNWSEQVKEIKAKDFNFPAYLDMTNISVNYDDAALLGEGHHYKSYPVGNSPELSKIAKNRFMQDVNILDKNPIFLENCRQAMMTGEPGFSFNFGDKENETLRNA